MASMQAVDIKMTPALFSATHNYDNLDVKYVRHRMQLNIDININIRDVGRTSSGP